MTDFQKGDEVHFYVNGDFVASMNYDGKDTFEEDVLEEFKFIANDNPEDIVEAKLIRKILLYTTDYMQV